MLMLQYTRTRTWQANYDEARLNSWLDNYLTNLVGVKRNRF